MYLTRSQICMVWNYDDRCRLVGEDVWEFDDAEHAYIKLDPADVLTADQAGKLLDPLMSAAPAGRARRRLGPSRTAAATASGHVVHSA